MAGAFTGPLVLPADVELLPVAELPAAARRALAAGADDWALTRRGVRAPSRLLDARAAALLGEFRSPRTLIEAVLAFAGERREDPEAVLEEAFAFLQPLAARGFLLSPEAAAAASPLPPGAAVAGTTVVACLKAVEDVEVYQVRSADGFAALKIAGAEALAVEAAALDRLGGSGAPLVLARGELGDRAFLLLSWIAGIDAARAAAELRAAGEGAALLRLLQDVAAAYARVHERGLLHGDVHAENILVAAGGPIALLDFGHAAGAGIPTAPPRAGVPFYYEPELAAALAAGEPPPPATPAGEQYAVAALLYLLWTGRHRRDFSLLREEMLAELATAVPLSFAERGAEPWPALEEVLHRALALDPRQRFAAMADLAEALGRLAPPMAQAKPSIDPAAAALEAFLARATLPSEDSPAVGAASVAVALYRAAVAREDAALLAAADLWAERAAAAEGEAAGAASLGYGRAGRHVARAQIAHARADGLAGRRALDAFLAAGEAVGSSLDLVHGRAGLLIGTCLLLELYDPASPEARRLRERGASWADELWRELANHPPLAALAELPDLGMAHGWAGFLYAMLRFHRAIGVPVPPEANGRLQELAALAQPRGRGLAWPWAEGPGDRRVAHPTMGGWCGGGAGFVYLWWEADRTGPDGAFRKLAEGAAWNAWEGGPEDGTLCCGLAGRAYALLHHARATGGAAWLERARELGRRAAAALPRAESEESLLKGAAGIAALLADLERPESAAFPLFEAEGWGG